MAFRPLLKQPKRFIKNKQEPAGMPLVFDISGGFQELEILKKRFLAKIQNLTALTDKTKQETSNEIKTIIAGLEQQFIKDLMKVINASFQREIQPLVKMLEEKTQEAGKMFAHIMGIQKGDKGDKSIVGVDFPFPEDGKPGEDAVADIKVLAKKMLQLLPEEHIEIKHIKNLRAELRALASKMLGAGGGGGMGLVKFKRFAGNGSAKTFTLDFAPTSEGDAIILLLNGQVQENGLQFTVAGSVITTTFTPQNGDTLFAWIIT